MDNKKILAFVLLFVGFVFVVLGAAVNKVFLFIAPVIFMAPVIIFSSGLAKKDK